MSQTPLIVIIDDDASVREALQGLLHAVGFTTEAFSSAEAFLQSGRLDDTACLITDIQLRGMSGLQLQAHLSASGARIPIIIITALPGDGARALAAGAVCFLTKPVISEDLLTCIRWALDRSHGDPTNPRQD